ncbi:hypothetical protein D3C79_1088250 [compost metagenome]
MAVGVREELHIQCLVAQQVHDHAVVAERVVQAQGAGFLVVDGFLQALGRFTVKGQ